MDAHHTLLVDGGPDAPLPRGVTVSPDGEGYCCPTSSLPSCDCTPAGGFTLDPYDPYVCRYLNSICDGHPLDWYQDVDEHGCRVWRAGLTHCCNCPDEDAGLPGDADGG